MALATDGRSIVIEGPSGIGKTTSIRKAISQSGRSVVELSGRNPADIEVIRSLAELLPIGTALIDDFHRLPVDVRKSIADLMKTLADSAASHSKLVVVGIPNVGQSLVSFGRDLANRIEVVQFEANSEHKLEELLSKGEEALNIALNIKGEIVSAAQGSFYLAQMLAYHTCIRSKVLATEPNRRPTTESYETVKAAVMVNLARQFHDIAVSFARGSKLRREGRAPYFHLLRWLSESPTWMINTDRETDRNPTQRGSVTQVVKKGYLAELIASSESIQSVLHFDADNHSLIAQDPQFIFYLRNASWTDIGRDAGFTNLDFPSRYDFALSFAGTDRAIAQSIFEALEEREFEVFYDYNEQHRIIGEDVEEYLAPIYRSEAMIVVCILGPAYPTRVWTKFEGDQFKQRFGNGAVIPVVLDTAPLGMFDKAAGVGHFGWKASEPIGEQADKLAELLSRKCVEQRNKPRKSGTV